MKIVWVMTSGVFVRYYDGVIRALAARGHDVVLAYEVELTGHPGAIRGARLAAEFDNVSITQAPSPGNAGWSTLAHVGRMIGDYLRYFEPAYIHATKIRTNAGNRLPPSIAALCRRLGRVSPVRRALVRLLRVLEGAVPLDAAAVEFLRAHRPDVMAVTPLVEASTSFQVDVVKAARALGIPSVAGVASWDNLTTKSLMHVMPDRVIVWNDLQRREAVALHGATNDQVIVTGAQLFDQWFDWRPPLSHAAFCAKVGLPADRPYVLYVGSGPFIGPGEPAFVQRWLRSLRSFDDPAVAEAPVMIRPHPRHYRHWLAADFQPFAPAVLWPRYDDWTPFEPGYADDFAASMHYSAAVVGINTSAMIEAGILGCPVSTIRAREFAYAQEGTPHFEYFRNAAGGLVYEHDTEEEQFAFLGRAIRAEPGLGDKGRDFLAAVVRPHGWGDAATPRVAAALEECATVHVQPMPPGHPVLRMLLYPLAGLAVLLKKLRRNFSSAPRPG